MGEFQISRLDSGGIITNYHCTSRCRHCLYRCGPKWPKDYITREMAVSALRKCLELGCSSVHIGGGEPFLNFEGLKSLLQEAQRLGVQIQYVETNASWAGDRKRVRAKLEELLRLDVNTLLVSISPFHIEYIPIGRVLTLLEVCQDVGMGIFPWTADFLQEFTALQPDRRYTIKELQKIFGEDYLERVRSRYWIHPGGRALETFFKGGTPLEELLALSSRGCKELTDTSHFHIDLYGNYIPGLCAGLAIRLKDLGATINSKDYPVLLRLFTKGVAGLYEWASSDLGFKPRYSSYGSKCSLCYEIRRFLLKVNALPSLSYELAPHHHYKN